MPEQIPPLPDIVPQGMQQQGDSQREVVIVDNGKTTRIPGTGTPDSPKQVKHEVTYADGSVVKVEVRAPMGMDPNNPGSMTPGGLPGTPGKGQGGGEQGGEQNAMPQVVPPELAQLGSQQFGGEVPSLM